MTCVDMPGATGVPAAAARALSRYEREFPARANLSAGDTRSDYVHLVQSGWVCRTKLLADGRRQIMGVLLPGDVCGLNRGVTATHGVSICSLTPCRVIVAPWTKVLQACEADADTARTLWSKAARQNAIVAELIVSLGRRSALERMSHLLCELSLRQGVGSQAACEFPLTQVDLSDLLGLSVVHVNRVLQILRRRGLVELQRSRLTIIDVERLQDCGGFDPAYLTEADAESASISVYRRNGDNHATLLHRHL